MASNRYLNLTFVLQVEHLDSLIKLKDERIEELQKQLDRKQARRKEVEAYQNSLAVPFDTVQSPVVGDILPVSRKSSVKLIESGTKIARVEESKIPVPKVDLPAVKSVSKPSITEVCSMDMINNNVDRIKSDVFKEVEIVDAKENLMEENKPEIRNDDEAYPDSLDMDYQCEGDVKDKIPDGFHDVEEFKDSEQEVIVTIEESIHKEISDIINTNVINADLNYVM